MFPLPTGRSEDIWGVAERRRIKRKMIVPQRDTECNLHIFITFSSYSHTSTVGCSYNVEELPLPLPSMTSTNDQGEAAQQVPVLKMSAIYIYWWQVNKMVFLNLCS